MGIADIDFKAAPSITNAIAARVKHENWGYLDMDKWTPHDAARRSSRGTSAATA